ncbi:MAG: outer membrane protein transport protein [Sulfuricaulis sp.]|uniref:OmpP1/FadL family transporter n=1 Tax=Sulfuricaulis sp. TaxID=2003553 RepID=UPI003C68EFAF
MSGMKRNLVLALAVAAAVAAPSAFATYGYFSHGYGMKSKGMAGAVTALADDTFGGANNPASMVWVGNRVDFGLDWFSPDRSMERTGSTGAFPPNLNIDATAVSDSTDFFIPEFGYNAMINPDMSFGVTVYGNGGMNTNYPTGQIPGPGVCNAFGVAGTSFNALCGNTALGVDLMQLIIAPTFAYKITSNNSVGISPLLAYQKFKAEGLQAFDNPGFSSSPGNVTNNGYSGSTGVGVRVGWLGKFTESFSAGAAYSSKITMSKFDKYKGLFAEEGQFDMPSNYNAGIALKAMPQMTFTLDYQVIKYSDSKAVNNPSTNTGLLGTDSGRGFGWDDVSVMKIGFEYKASSATTYRAGYGKTDNPIQSRDVTFNILAPGVVEDHFTLGFTHALDKDSELTMAFMHASENSVSGNSLFSGLTGGNGGQETIKMSQKSLGIGWGKKW